MSPSPRATSLIGLLTGLIDVLEQENAILNKPNIQQLTDLVEEKQILFFEYDKQVEELAGDVSFANSLSDEAKEEIKQLSLRFEQVSRENEIKLSAALKTSSLVVDHITKAASKATGASIAAYGGDGTSRMTGNRAAPISVNRTL